MSYLAASADNPTRRQYFATNAKLTSRAAVSGKRHLTGRLASSHA
jgi:hypothetical protein